MNPNYHILEYDKIIGQLEQCANTVKARERIRSLEPYLEERGLTHALHETTQAREMLDLIGMPPIPIMENVEEYLDKAVKGDMLLPEELEQIEIFLAAVGRMDDYLERGKIHGLSIAYYNENLVALGELREEIVRAIRGGRIDDYASGALKDIRRELQFLENKIREKAEGVIRSQKAFMADSYIVKRDGHICVPVKKEYKSRIAGTVIGQSSTGATCFMEPKSVALLQEEMDLKRMEEDCEERRILYVLTCMVAQQETAFREDLRVIVRLDFMFAKGKLSAEMKAVCPRINTSGYIFIKQARHPQIGADICVPLDVEIGRNERGMVITGPNTGGKTVTIKTVGLLSLMACSGLHIPCEEADISMQNQVLCDIGDGQDISDNLSTFSAHIRNVMDILRAVTRESLVILDELGSGTDPAEGMGIAIAILEQLRRSGCVFLVTTHYPEVKTYARRHSQILSARMAFDRENLKPLYRLEMGKTGDSCALYIAKRLGMPDEMLLMAAQEAYGEMSSCAVRELHLEESRAAKLERVSAPFIVRSSAKAPLQVPVSPFSRGDSVTVLPQGQIGIVVKPADQQGNILVQVKKEKLLINHKRLKLKVAAQELYPEDYDFSIIFDTVENRKARHKMDKGHQEGLMIEAQD